LVPKEIGDDLADIWLGLVRVERTKGASPCRDPVGVDLLVLSKTAHDLGETHRLGGTEQNRKRCSPEVDVRVRVPL